MQAENKKRFFVLQMEQPSAETVFEMYDSETVLGTGTRLPEQKPPRIGMQLDHLYDLHVSESLTDEHREMFATLDDTSNSENVLLKARLRILINSHWVEEITLSLKELQNGMSLLQQLLERHSTLPDLECAMPSIKKKKTREWQTFVTRAKSQLRKLYDAHRLLDDAHRQTRELALNNQEYLLRQLTTMALQYNQTAGQATLYRPGSTGNTLWPEQNVFQTFANAPVL